MMDTVKNTYRPEAPVVSVIPATKRSVQNAGQMKKQSNIRVAAYCRVSTEDEGQQTSYARQKAFYSALIQGKDGWHFAGIYADEAISGTSRAHRVAFNRMIEDAKAGKLDYIVTKSISRFARNTVDTLNCVRELRQLNPPVGIYFEKENIDTLDATGELILTILSALAQDESRSISDNIRWAFQKNFQAGIPQINLNRMIGYDKGEHGEWVINPGQAEIVRFIFERYVIGYSANKIAKALNQRGDRTINGKNWTASGVLIVLRNEKYVGDLEMQKTITKDFLNHRSIANHGEAPKYYVENHHEGIIDRLTWEKVQAILHERPRKNPNSMTENYKKHHGPMGSPFRNLRCGAIRPDGNECRDTFRRLTYSGIASGYTDQRSLKSSVEERPEYQEKYSYAYPVWRCRRKIRDRKEKHIHSDCPSKILHECAIEQSFMEMLYWLKRDYDENQDASRICMLYQEAYAKTYRRIRMNQVSTRRLEVLEEQICELETGNRDQEEIQSHLDALKKERTILQEEQALTGNMEKNFTFFLQCLQKLPEQNPAGMKLNINGLDVVMDVQKKNPSELLKNAPDYLIFEKGIYCAFIQYGIVRGDEIEYMTNFGVSLTSKGNYRTLASFVGYRKAASDGTVEILDAPYKVAGTHIQYRRYLHK